MVDLTEIFCHMRPKKVLVVGDVIFDRYTKGEVNRICPEAPVPVLKVTEEVTMPGGAANVALNLQALGAHVELLTRIGDDVSGELLVDCLNNSHISVDGIIVQKNSRTPTKNRLIADGQQLIRTDYERDAPLSEEVEKQIKVRFEEALGCCDVVAVSDYAKGLLTDSLLLYIFRKAQKKNVPVIVDPKGRTLTKYSGAFILKPNRKEAYDAAGITESAPLREVAREIFSQTRVENLLITLSGDGMALFHREGAHHIFPVTKKDVRDVTGAGDTSLAMLCFAAANQIPLHQAVELANIASGVAIEKLGCASVELSEVLREMIKIDPLSKIFDSDSNFFIVETALKKRANLVLNLKGQTEMDSSLFHCIRKLHEEKQRRQLVVFLDAYERNDDFVKLLASMYEIDFVLLDKKWYNDVTSSSPGLKVVNYRQQRDLEGALI